MRFEWVWNASRTRHEYVTNASRIRLKCIRETSKETEFNLPLAFTQTKRVWNAFGNRFSEWFKNTLIAFTKEKCVSNAFGNRNSAMWTIAYNQSKWNVDKTVFLFVFNGPVNSFTTINHVNRSTQILFKWMDVRAVSLVLIILDGVINLGDVMTVTIYS